MGTQRGLRIGVAGATGLVGRAFLELLARRELPVAGVRLFASARSAGQHIPFGGRDLPVEELSGADPNGLDLVFFSAGKQIARAEAPRFAAAGAIVIDNSSAFREEPEVPLVVPEVNADALARVGVGAGGGRLVANPNCSTILLVLGLAPFERAIGLEEVVVSTYQSVSGAGRRARDELLDQARAHARGEPERWEHYDRPIFLNLIPKIGELQSDGDCFEEVKMVRETRRILARPELPVYATTVRVPVERCHSESVWVRLRWPVTQREVDRLLAAAPGLALEALPSPRENAGREETCLGRLRIGPGDARVVRFWLVGDQIWKGAALNALQIAERLLAQGCWAAVPEGAR